MICSAMLARSVPYVPQASLVFAASLGLVVLAGCPPPQGGDAGPEDAGLEDAGLEDAGQGDAGTVDGGVPACTPGDRAESVIGIAGGTFTHCGARVEVPPDGLTGDVTFALEVVEAPTPLPFELELAGPAFLFEADGEAPGVTLVLPAAREGRILRMFVYAGEEWNEIEPCVVEDEAIGQEAAPGFVYAALREVDVYPGGPTGLGDGTVARTFQGATRTFDIDGDLAYAIYDQGPDGARAVTVRSTLPLPEDHVDLFHVVFILSPEGTADVVEVTTGSTAGVDGFWTWVGPVHQTGATLTLQPDSGPRLVGTLEATLYQGEVTSPLTATLDVAAEKFRYPPEGYCAFPEG